MKKESRGKRTIQALGDKILLSKLLENLCVPQMPLLFSTYSKVDIAKVESLVAGLEESDDPDAFDIVIKPTHLSNAAGTVILSKEKWQKDGYCSSKLAAHMEEFMAKRAHDTESEALKALVPGFIVQPRYRSSVDYNFPLEMRVITLWGRARLGIWWWGRHGSDPKGQRTTWLVRCPKVPGKLGTDDDWEAIHEHIGMNRGFEMALRLFRKAMPAMSAAAEGIATAVGAPFLRSDFFVGNSKWGVRLNEVAYGSGVDYRQRAAGRAGLIDDGPTIAQILQEGLSLCQHRPPVHFLSRLGATDAPYEAPEAREDGQGGRETPEPGMSVAAVSEDQRETRIPEAICEMMEEESSCPTLSGASCETSIHMEATRKAQATAAAQQANFRPPARITPFGYRMLVQPGALRAHA
eukprot:CAMPEP_0179306842 /NCGR_PEP_ID=MMETSP0797-20121207/50340_1 /TAXON_ID=47934 /ORGANISM="Dinophysis acuminata, Strain DAEP01" /LENGTH=407 /DNA_ID=CAMNT_0021016519 /DNA_START=44 /DNA_END=1267 /DNA_ORIENTATION=+